MEIFWPDSGVEKALARDEAHVFAVPLDEIHPSDEKLAAILTDDECQRAARLRFDKPRRQFVAGRAALRTVLGGLLNVPPVDVEITCATGGKPRLEHIGTADRLHFNLAHSRDIVLVAIAIGCEIGVDVEHLRPVNHLEQIARRYFHPAEVEEILAAPPAERDITFMRCWTAKEAVLKAMGSGLSESLSEFRVPLRAQGGAWIDTPFEGVDGTVSCWLELLLPSDGYVGAVAIVGQRRRVKYFALRL